MILKLNVMFGEILGNIIVVIIKKHNLRWKQFYFK